MNFYGKKIGLRAIEREDLELLHKWSNNPEINLMLGGWHFPSSKRDQEAWLETLNMKSNHQRFAIETESEGCIGMANIVDINWKDRNAFHGMLLGDKEIRGKGYGVDTIMTIMKYAFEELGLERLDGSMIEYNKPSIKVYTEKCGWSIEGVKKKYYYRKGKYWDKIIVGILREEYFSNSKINDYWQENY